jgi:SpoVK/Ycf46/Vps4 family AAA+-type ATPase
LATFCEFIEKFTIPFSCFQKKKKTKNIMNLFVSYSFKKCFSMKKQKFCSQKFQKKYFFFQKSFFDFLYWRSIKNMTSHSFTQNQLNSGMDFAPFEQEKMCFYEYWKSPEHKKIENTLKSSTNLLSAHQNSFQAFKKTEKKRKFLLKNTKYFNFLTSQKFHSLFLKKRKEKKSSLYPLKDKKTLVFFEKQKRNERSYQNFKNESFLPQNSSFELFRNFNSLNSQKRGEFFPTKKNFQQYWIFPFLGVLFFFSQNTSSLYNLSFSKNYKKLTNFFSFESFQTPLFFVNQKNQFLSLEKNDKNHRKPFEYSFSQRSLNDTSIFQNLEKLEYEKFLNFSQKIYRNTLLSFEIENQNKNKKNDLKLFFLNENFQKKLETKRNSFCWKWYSLNSDFFNSQKITPTSFFQIPQKAEFFMVFKQQNPIFLNQETMEKRNLLSFSKRKNEKKYHNFQFLPFENIEKNFGPLFDFSKNLFFLDEYKRHLSLYTSPQFFSDFLLSPLFFCEAKKYSTNKNFDFSNFKTTASSFKTSEILKFLTNEFLQDPEEKKYVKKNIYFLEKWSKTQKFSFVSFSEKKKKKFFKLQMNQNLEKNMYPKFMNLDLLYSKKIFQKFKSRRKEKSDLYFPKKSKFLEGVQQGDDSLLVKQFRKENRQNHFVDNPVSQKKFLSLKKQTFHFFHLSHCTQIFQKIDHLCLKTKFEKRKTLFYRTSVNANTFPRKKEKQFLSLEKTIFSRDKNLKEYNFVQSSDEKKILFQFNRPLLFQFLKTEKTVEKLYPKTFRIFFEKPSFFQFSLSTNQTKMEFQKNMNFFPQNLETDKFQFSFFSEHQKTQNFFFQFSKFDFFKKLKNNFLNKNKKTVFSNFSNFINFQTNFLFETNEFQKAFLFSLKLGGNQANKNNTFLENSFSENTKGNVKCLFSLSPRFFALKPHFIESAQKIEKNQKNGIHSHFFGVSKKYRKFEKTFRAFFSPFKVEKNAFEKRVEQKGYKQEKRKNDVLFLQSLSTFLKKNHQTQFSFFIPSSLHKFTEGNTEIAERTKKRKQNKKMFYNIDTNMASHFFQKNFSFVSEEKIKKKKENAIFQRKRFSPELVFKRDGFLTLSTESKEKKMSLQRLEKEKIFQKKRRLQKEKLETRRRKKRKRFFPRPIWLRLNLYKKFLKIRHSKKVFMVSSHQSEKKKNVSPFLFGKTILKYTPSFFYKRNDTKKEKWFQKTEQKQFNKYCFKKLKKNTLFKTSSDFQMSDVSSLFFKKQNSTFQSKTYQKNLKKKKSLFLQSQKNHSLFSFDKKAKEKMYVPLFGIPAKERSLSFFSNKKNGMLREEKVSENIEYYKMSNEIYQEFLRFSWKSSWFLNNFKPYTQTIQQNFQKIQSVESRKNLSNFFDLFQMKNVFFFFHDFPFFSVQSMNDFLIRKSVFQKFSWYSNVHNSFSARNAKNSIFSEREQFSSAFDPEKKRKIFEYNRILSKRISELLISNAGKLKFSENMTNDSFFENFKVNQRKNENIFSGSHGGVNNSFFTKTALFFEKFQIPSEPVIPAFSIFSSLFHDFSIKPTGDMPTLRAMWAFQKTNFSHFRERNSIQNVWAFQKKQNATNSLKGTKKIMNFLRKKNFFEKFKTPQEFKYDWSIVESNPQKEKSVFYPSAKAMRKQKSKLFSSFFQLDKKSSQKHDFLQSLNAMTYKKFINVEKKSSLFGIQSFKQNSKISNRYLKFHLFSSLNHKKLSFTFQREAEKTKTVHSFFPFSNEKNEKIATVFEKTHVPFRFAAEKVQSSSIHFFSSDKKTGIRFAEKKKNPQNSAKSSFHFWWAQKPFQYFDFQSTSQFQIYSDFYKKKSFFGNDKRNFSLQQEFSFLNISFFLFGAFFFHFALFYTLFKIPEIRSVFKLSFFVFSKFWTNFFVVFFSIYTLFQRYTKNGLNLLKSSSPFSEIKKRNAIDVKEKFISFFNGQEQKIEMNLRTYVFLNSSFQSNKIQKNEVQFSNFVFEFFPRFASFSNQKDVSKNFEKFSFPFFCFSNNKSKEVLSDSFFLYFSAFFDKKKSKENLYLFAKPMTLKTGGPIFSKRKALFLRHQKNHFGDKKLNSYSFFKLSQNTLLKRENEFSFLSLNDIYKEHLYFLHQRIEKSLPFSKTEKILSQFALSFLVFGKHVLYVPYHISKLSSSISTKIFEIFEGIFYAFYKFLEKPAEFMIEFIAFVFLIEWSSDILGFFPESIESSIWKSSQKLLRPTRTGTFFSLFGFFFFGISAQNFSQNSFSALQSPQNIFFFNPLQFLLFTGFFQFSNLTTYILQKRLLSLFENAPSLLYQPDIDILVRQRKGIFFWDIWAEILFKAAEKYNVNLPSFVTLKEEQELFIEKLVRDSDFFENLQLHSKKSVSLQSTHAEGQHKKKEKESFSSFLQNFVLQNRPASFFDFYFLSRDENSFFSILYKSKKNTKFRLFFLNSSSFNKNKAVSSFFQQPDSKSGIFRNFCLSSAGKNGADTLPITLLSPFLNENLKNQKMSTFLTKKNAQFFPFFENSHFLEVFQKTSEESFLNFFSGNGNLKKVDRWECNQYATFQSIETNFFLDIYPPKSFKHVHFLKYYEPAHAILGSFICEIYAGIFPKQVSKNILVVGESGPSKTFFLRAFAGETEMKIITENASRYAVVQRGVAVGMKYLRDVFDAIALQTPCFFVMEDLHIIGSKRPFLISENENAQNNQSFFGYEQQEVHETNQLIYQSSRHSISDFRRPYKGDFSMGIPTNSFLQTFYSPFFSNQKSFLSSIDASFYSIRKGHVFQNSQFFGGNWNSSISNFLSSPLPLDSLESIFQNSGKIEEKRKSFSFSTQKKSFKIQSRLQFSKEQIFAPPATSPFTVLLMKEQKKLKPKKIVRETSWGGLSTDQILLSQKETSSIRAKIAVLAEKTMNLSRGKFDMITDLLVIIDSVRSNRGFVVFGTTHKPSSLDPALRRPGRFDETLSLSRTPNFRNRFEIFKMNFENSFSTFDFFDASILTENFSEMDLFDILSQTKLSFLHNYKFAFQKSFSVQNHVSFSKNSEKILQNDQEKRILQTQFYSQRSLAKAFHALFKSPIFEDFYTQKQFFEFSSSFNFFSQKSHFSLRDWPFFLNGRYTLRPKGPSHMVSLAYSKLGIFIAETNILHDPTSFIGFNLDTEKNYSPTSQIQANSMNSSGNILFDSFNSTKSNSFGGSKNKQILVFLSGKVTEFMISPFFPIGKNGEQKNTFSESISNSLSEHPATQKGFLFENPFSFFPEKLSYGQVLLEKNSLSDQKFYENFFFTKIKTIPNKDSSFLGKTNFSWTVYGNNENWRSVTPFLCSLIQKRFLFTKNLLLSKMLFFENMDQRRKPPSPPGSSIFMPAKKYENFKRTEADFFQKGHFSIHEKIQMHQKQRFLKQLYNLPVQKYFRSELRKNQKTTLSSSFQEFAYFDSVVQKSSSSHFYYRKYIQVRHRFSNMNQWWNGMFPEHTRETTYLSDVDWRTMFVSSSEISSLNKKSVNMENQQEIQNKLENSKQSSDQTVEFLMDFPDAEQFYNPRNRRWFFKSNSHFQIVDDSFKNLTFWSIFEKDLQYEIFSHFLIESFYQSFSYFEKKREMLDFFAFQFLHKGFLKEFDFLTTFSRF